MSALESLFAILSKKIDEKTFQFDHDDVLDQRDSPTFETGWLRVHRELEAAKAGLSTSHLHEIDALREVAYKRTYSLTNSAELSACVSDDFELIGLAFLLKHQDPWLEKLLKKYSRGAFPH
jgi:hypothetical protein